MALAANGEVQWTWDEKNYDSDANKEIEEAFQNGKASIFPTKGFFSIYGNQGIYQIIFDRENHIHKQINTNAPTNQPRIVLRDVKNNNNNNNKSDESDSIANQSLSNLDPYTITWEVDYMLEINVNNVWIAATIIDITNGNNKNNNNGRHRRHPKQFSVKYDRTNDGQESTITLNGRDKHLYRAIGSGYLSNHSFGNFSYTNTDDNKNEKKKSKSKKLNPKNAKHPAYYINRLCGKCNGKGNQRFNCNKCKNGIFLPKLTKIHHKCQGKGCNDCNETGKYPNDDVSCKACHGSGVYIKRCPDYPQGCVNGFFLPRIVTFKPDSCIGNNVLRLYHVTDEQGANGIKEFGTMQRGSGGSYGGGIYFAESRELAMKRARNHGYLVIADVCIGKCKLENKPNVDMNYNKLRNEFGYDSIKGKWLDGMCYEYVVYNWEQVWVHVVLPIKDMQ